MDKVVANCNKKIWVLSDVNYQVEVLMDTEQLLHCKVSSPLLPYPILMTGIYAKCTRQERRVPWEDMRTLSDTSLPWCIGGDFNIGTNMLERENGGVPKLNAMNDFGNCIMDCGLIDIGFEGLPFTWTWTNFSQRLDRILFNNKWLECFSLLKTTHGVRRCSDHRPLLISAGSAPILRSQSFRFQEMWLQHPDCVDSIATHWRLPTRNRGLRKLWEKLLRLKQHLTWWNKHIFRNLFHKLKEEEDKVAKSELDYHLDNSLINKANLRIRAEEYNKLLDMEESFWRQKASCSWNL